MVHVLARTAVMYAQVYGGIDSQTENPRYIRPESLKRLQGHASGAFIDVVR